MMDNFFAFDRRHKVSLQYFEKQQHHLEELTETNSSHESRILVTGVFSCGIFGQIGQ